MAYQRFRQTHEGGRKREGRPSLPSWGRDRRITAPPSQLARARELSEGIVHQSDRELSHHEGGTIMQSLPNRKRRTTWKHVGKVALGKKSEKGAPQDTNYFILKEKSFKDGNYYFSERFHQIVGATPHELDIIIPYATADECLHDRRVKYGGNGIPFCKSKDGVRAMRWV